MLEKLLKAKWWVACALFCLIIVPLMAFKEHQANERLKAFRTEVCSTSKASQQQGDFCTEAHLTSNDFLPWGLTLLQWPNGITAWAIIITGFAIAWQGDQTRRAALATERSVATAQRQVEMVRDKERARIELTAQGLSLQSDYPLRWNLASSLRLRNLGPSRAYVIRFETQLAWCERNRDEPKPDFSGLSNALGESYIDPTDVAKEPEQLPVYLFDTEQLNLDWFAENIYRGNVRVFLWARLEYSTVGVTYKKVLACEWQATGGPGSFAHALLKAGHGKEPTENGSKISAGYWRVELDEEREAELTQQSNWVKTAKAQL